MAREKSYDSTTNKFPKLWETVDFNESQVFAFSRLQNVSTNVNSFQRYLFNTVEHVPVVFDLYDYQGVTFTTAEDSPEPEELYRRNESDTGWEFILPIFGYRIPHQEDIEELTGTDEWEFNTSIVVSKSRVFYQGLTERTLDKLKPVTILSARFGDQLFTPVNRDSFRILIDPINQVFTDYSVFTRWVQKESGYDLEIYVFYPLLEDHDIKVTTKVFAINKEVVDEIQPFKIQTSETGIQAE